MPKTTNLGVAARAIGNDPGKGSDYTFIGNIADVLLYNSSLSQAQLLNLFGAGVGQGRELPVIITPPASSTLYAGRSAQLTVVATTFGNTLTYQWQVYTNGAWVNVPNGNGYSGANGSILSISDVAATGAASYQVIVSDFLGSVTSTPPAAVTGVVPTTLPAYPQAVSNLNPVAYWRLGETGTSAYDLWGGFTGTFGSVGQDMPGIGA